MKTVPIAAEKVIRLYYVYLLTNKTHSVLYTGVTNNLQRRLYEHKNELVPGFTRRYHVHKLVCFEETSDVNAAISREKPESSTAKQRRIPALPSA